jgi:hypothetical protein
MVRFYECGVRYNKVGATKKTTEFYLVDACSFTEAEYRIVEEIRPYTCGELDVVSIKRTNYSEIVFDEYNLNSAADADVQKLTRANRNASELADKWFKAKVNFITLDEKTGKESRTSTMYIINAGSINAAHDTLVAFLKDTSIVDYEIATLDETRIMEVYVYDFDKHQCFGVKNANMAQTPESLIKATYDAKQNDGRGVSESGTQVAEEETFE